MSQAFYAPWRPQSLDLRYNSDFPRIRTRYGGITFLLAMKEEASFPLSQRIREGGGTVSCCGASLSVMSVHLLVRGLCVYRCLCIPSEPMTWRLA